ncbi:YobI family P-loop NTPase [Arthrobacter sp. zg-Y179]|uniref:YobI family P-loop NTPase n=1 Tax=Arthrobacter sp. zg-Y179 TaxID=2894188 RepID=UPI003FA460C1
MRHLDEAVLDKRNRIIALTGCYRAGKSSVLGAFEEKHRKTTIRITLAGNQACKERCRWKVTRAAQLSAAL